MHVLSVGNHCTFLPLYLLLHRMVPHLCPAVTKVGCLKHLAQQQIYHQYFTPSSTPTTTGRVEPASIGDILDRIMNIVVVTTNQHQMVRCVNFVCLNCNTVLSFHTVQRLKHACLSHRWNLCLLHRCYYCASQLLQPCTC